MFKKRSSVEESPGGISRNVFFMGLVSLFNDVASEMIYPIVPIFLTTVLQAPPSILGLIEGTVEATASFLKVVSGWLSDRFKKRKIFAVSGYSLSTVGKLLLGFATSWNFVFLARFLDRFGKGTRDTPRDALISESTTPQNRGKAFGFHRAMDNLGAVIGPLLAIALMDIFHENLRQIFFIAFVPSLIGVLLLMLFVKERKQNVAAGHNLKNPVQTAAVKFKLKDLSRPYKIFLFINVIFALGNSADAFLIIRSQNLGFSLTMTIFAYASFNLVSSLFSYPAGIIMDRIGPRNVIVAGLAVFAAVYLFFGLITQNIFLWILFPVYGMYIALTDGVGRAYISKLVPHEKVGTALGIYQTTNGLCTFFASGAAGLLWTYFEPGAPFLYGSLMASIAALLFLIFGPKPVKAAG